MYSKKRVIKGDTFRRPHYCRNVLETLYGGSDFFPNFLCGLYDKGTMYPGAEYEEKCIAHAELEMTASIENETWCLTGTTANRRVPLSFIMHTPPIRVGDCCTWRTWRTMPIAAHSSYTAHVCNET